MMDIRTYLYALFLGIVTAFPSSIVMPRWFNISGPCNRDDHYMLPPTVRLPSLERLIRQRSPNSATAEHPTFWHCPKIGINTSLTHLIFVLDSMKVHKSMQVAPIYLVDNERAF